MGVSACAQGAFPSPSPSPLLFPQSPLLPTAQENYSSALKQYLEAGSVTSAHFTQEVPSGVWTVQVYQRMLACCTAIQLPTHVGHTTHYAHVLIHTIWCCSGHITTSHPSSLPSCLFLFPPHLPSPPSSFPLPSFSSLAHFSPPSSSPPPSRPPSPPPFLPPSLPPLRPLSCANTGSRWTMSWHSRSSETQTCRLRGTVMWHLCMCA